MAPALRPIDGVQCHRSDTRHTAVRFPAGEETGGEKRKPAGRQTGGLRLGSELRSVILRVLCFRASVLACVSASR
ncbi:hypothetical protein GCM10009839_72850 [Catenulispora yoronensis]|uniref:Uncharacterized protein n=1 Tax=Catenulispora yoronensis TaxID=450799 RepID=A0ABN2V8A1_9ACTN